MSKKRQWASICTPILIPAVDEPRKTYRFFCNTIAQRQKILHPKLTCNDAWYVILVRVVNGKLRIHHEFANLHEMNPQDRKQKCKMKQVGQNY